MKSIFKKIVCLVFVCCSLLPVFAADATGGKTDLNVQISQIDSSKFRKMKAYVTIEDAQGNIATGIDAEQFKFSVDSDPKMVKGVKVVEFRNTNEGISYNFIFSSALNLGSGLLNIQEQAIIDFRNSMSESDEISVYTMGSKAYPVFENVKRDDFDPTQLTTIRPSEENAKLYDSIADLTKIVKDKPMSRKVIIVISDQKDYQSILTGNQFLDMVGKNGIPLYTVGIRAPASSTIVNLEQMAKSTNGKYYYSPNVRELKGVIEKVANYIMNTYIVNFKIKTIGGIRGDGKSHVLNLSINIREQFGSSTKQFIAPKHIFPWWVKLIILVVFILLVVGIVFLIIITKKSKRRRMGITNRKCPECGNRMKDSWDDCPFCYYMPELKKGNKKEKKDKKKGKK